MSRSFGVLKWKKGDSCPKSLDKLANGNCHSLYRQLPFALPANAVRPTGNCHSLYRQLPFALPAIAIRPTGKCRSLYRQLPFALPANAVRLLQTEFMTTLLADSWTVTSWQKNNLHKFDLRKLFFNCYLSQPSKVD